MTRPPTYCYMYRYWYAEVRRCGEAEAMAVSASHHEPQARPATSDRSPSRPAHYVRDSFPRNEALTLCVAAERLYRLIFGFRRNAPPVGVARRGYHELG